MDIRLLLVPYDSGQRNIRMGAGPEHLCASGLKEHLTARGHNVEMQVIEPASANWRAEVQTSFELMRAVANHVRRTREDGRFPLVLSGNCNAAIGVIAGLGPRTGVVWLDAHGDFNTPQTTMSGFLDGMTLATATGRCWAEMARSIEGFEPVPDHAVVLLGARDLDPGEEAALARSKVVRLSAEAATIGIHSVLQSLSQEMAQFYLHLDLDALDPHRRTSQQLLSARWILERKPADAFIYDCPRSADQSSYHCRLRSFLRQRRHSLPNSASSSCYGVSRSRAIRRSLATVFCRR